jgi:hypothetical protein
VIYPIAYFIGSQPVKTVRSCDKLTESNMKNNPFQSPATNIGSPAPDTQAKGVSFSAIANHLARFSLAACILILVPLLFVPRFSDLFEEFGIELPLVTQLLIAISKQINMFALIYVPLAIVSLLVIETLMFLMPKSFYRTLVSLAIWLLLLTILIVGSLALLLPIRAISSGLA